MIYPTFIEFFSSIPKCTKEVHSVNTVHLKPYSDEVYSFLLPESFTLILSDCVVVDSRGIEHAVAFNESQNAGRRFLNISNIIYDNWEFAYLKVKGGVMGPIQTIYSSAIRVSSLEQDNTTYIKYRDNRWQFFGGIRLNIWYWHKKPMNEITTYYQVSKEQTISVGSKREHVERYYLDNVEINAATALCDVLTYPIVYFDGIRTSCYEMPDIEGLQAAENFVSADVMVTKNYNDQDENIIDLSVYVIGNRQNNEMIGDGENNIINSNINV